MHSHHDKKMPAGARILVAEDNPVNLEVALRILEKLGYAADPARDGQEAIDRHCAAAYDLVLMDCEMPGVDGYQATQRIRAMEGAARHTPIIALSAGDEERERCLSAGMDAFLQKPLRPQILAGALARWLPSAAIGDAVSMDAGKDELDTVRRMFGADFAELSALYRTDTPLRIATLRQAHANGNLAQLASVAHVLSGSSMSIGATGLSALCRELELHAKAGSLGDSASRLVVIEAEYLRISSKLQSLLDED